MPVEPDYRPVLATYPNACHPTDIQFLGNAGGFSGACFWRLTAPAGTLGLRRWPREHPMLETLQFIQAVLWHVNQEGFDRVPLPLETWTRAGYVEHAGHFWELVPWIPGRADYHAAPSRVRLANAMASLAEFHIAAASFPLPLAGESPSPGILMRLEKLRSLRVGDLERLRTQINDRDWPELAARARRCLELFPLVAPRVETLLAEAARLGALQQPCIRDIWDAHVFFDGDRVTGFVDFGAMQPDSVATDIARLLGSLAGDDADAWKHGLASYESIRRLTVAETALVTAFDAANVLLSSGTTWIDWYYGQGRQFENREGVLARLDHFLGRLAYRAGAK